MERQPTLKHEKRSTKSNKKKPVKVVYISNPMKIKATPSEFRAVVQKFTGRYATSPPPYHQLIIDNTKKDNDNKKEEEQQQQLDKWQDDHSTSIDARYTNGFDISYESSCREDQVMQDMILTPQMFEGFPSLFPYDFGSS